MRKRPLLGGSLSVIKRRRIQPWRRSALVALMLTMLSVAAFADQYDALLTRAIAAKERAREVNDPASWVEASRLFQQADQLRPSAETKYELAYAAEQLQQEDWAVELYEVALEQGLSGRAREHAQDFVTRLAPSMARLELRGDAETMVSIAGLVRATLPTRRPIVVFAGRTTLEIRDARGPSVGEWSKAALG
jgi:hypothetical protein